MRFLATIAAALILIACVPAQAAAAGEFRVKLLSTRISQLRSTGAIEVRVSATKARSATVRALGRQRISAARRPERIVLARPRKVRTGRRARIALTPAGEAALARCADLEVSVTALARRARGTTSRTIDIRCERDGTLVATPAPQAPDQRSAPIGYPPAARRDEPQPQPQPESPPDPALRVSGRATVDGDGGQVILRGGAVIRKSDPGYPVLTEHDWDNMRALGWNSIRLGFFWGRLMPEPGKIDTAYADAIAAIAHDAARHGLYVVLDSHQDVWGAPYGNGAPAWAEYDRCKGTHVDLAGATGAFAANYLSPWTLCQFTSFWDDATARSRYADALSALADRVGDEPLVAGWDLMNEPFQGLHPNGEFENRLLYPFYAELTAALRRHDPAAIAFEEPANAKNVHLPTSPDLSRAVLGARAGAVYAPHVYGLWDANDAFTERAPLVQANMGFSAQEAALMDAPLWYGEFGMRRGVPGGDDTLSQIYDIADSQLAGASVWEYLDPAYGPLDAARTITADRSKAFARAYPGRTYGALEGFSFNRATGAFEMSWRSSGEHGSTFVFAPAVHFPRGIDVAPGPGVTVAPVPGTQYLEVRASAGQRTLALTPAG